MKNLKILVFFVYIFQIIVNINCRQYYVPSGRDFHTATLIGTKIYFLGGRFDVDKYSNDFFYLDISKSFNNKTTLPFVNLSDKALKPPPPHYGAATSAFGDSIFFFGGDMGSLNDSSKLAYSFNTKKLEWSTVTVSKDGPPVGKEFMNAVTDNNDRIYIFGGRFRQVDYPYEYIYDSKMNIYDTINRIWTIGSNGGLLGRYGHTATFLPDTGEIIYIGGITEYGLIYTTYVSVYNTKGDAWSILTTKNPPPEKRYGHTAVLTNDKRIIVFGGARYYDMPVRNYYVVLDTKTLEWYHGRDVSTRAPFRGHTATLYNDYMFIAFGSINRFRLSEDILIYKIGEYANFTEVRRVFHDISVVNALLLLLSICILGYINVFFVRSY